ncbi:hypothetical protein H4I96_09497 [Botrytis cinerea]
MDSKRVRYDQLPLEENSSPPETRKTTSITRRLIQGFLCVAVLASIIIGSIWAWSHKHPNLPQYIDCGSSTEEAISKNCVMEPMIYGWIPRECYFADLSAQYSPFEDREWYTDDTYTVRIPPQTYGRERTNTLLRTCITRRIVFSSGGNWHWGLRGERIIWMTKVWIWSIRITVPRFWITMEGTSNSTNDVYLGFHRCERLAWV